MSDSWMQQYNGIFYKKKQQHKKPYENQQHYDKK